MTGAGALTYFEDVRDVVESSPGMTLTEAHVSLYRGLTGESGDPGAVPELLPLCISTGLGWRIGRPPLAVQAFAGFDWEIVKPLRVGDTITTRSQPVQRRALRDNGLIVEQHELVDQHGEVVQRGRFSFLVARRPRAGTPQKGVSAP